MADISKRRRMLNNIAGLAILGGLGWFSWRMFTVEGRTRDLCEAIEPGTTVQKLNAFLERQGLGPSLSGEGTHYIRGKGFEYACRLEIAGGRVTSVSLDTSLPDEQKIGR